MKKSIHLRVFSLFLALFLVVLIPATVSAYEIESSSFEDAHSIIQPRGSCSQNCGGSTRIICMRDRTKWYTTTHSYWLGNTCTYTAYTSSSKLVCTNCFHIDAEYDQHWCWNVHFSCGREYERLCICDVKDYGAPW